MPQTSVSGYPVTQNHIPEEQNPQQRGTFLDTLQSVEFLFTVKLRFWIYNSNTELCLQSLLIGNIYTAFIKYLLFYLSFSHFCV